MSVDITPALAAFLDTIGTGRAFAQVAIVPEPPGYRLTHVADRGRLPGELVPEPVAGLRRRAQFTASGAFRPLKSAPNLSTGWVCHAASPTELGEALDHLYPGGLADWFATRQDPVPATPFREYVGRQTGMYRTARDLGDGLAGAAVRACCQERFCLRRRLWTAPGAEPDAPDAKSDLPCLEPCAILLEFARRTQRMERDPKVALELAPGDLETLAAALEQALGNPAPDIREGDTAAPGNPRRIQLLLEKLRPHLGPTRNEAAPE